MYEFGDSAILSPYVPHPTDEHLEAFVGKFGKYFSEADFCHKDKIWIQFPFRDNAVDGASFTTTEEHQLLELSTDSAYKNMFETILLTQS